MGWMMGWWLGEIPTGFVCWWISRLRRLLGLLDQIWVQTPLGKVAEVRMFALAWLRCSKTVGRLSWT